VGYVVSQDITLGRALVNQHHIQPRDVFIERLCDSWIAYVCGEWFGGASLDGELR
jgi:hypothetical protein